MSNELVISSRAFQDAEKIRDWYDEQSYMAGSRFMDELNLFLTKLIKYPHQHRKINKDVRRCLMDVFPYIIYFTEGKGLITILRIRHSKQKPLKRFR
jgi:plasmid stabilization system protein ParE